MVYHAAFSYHRYCRRILGWTNLETRLEARDALDPNSSFVVGLDKVTEHIGNQAGESAIFYIKGDFTRPESLEAMHNLIGEMEDDEHVARLNGDGPLNDDTPLLDYLAAVVNSAYTRQQIEIASGVAITDSDSDLYPIRPDS
jgi:hypothetical protein